MSNSDCIGQDLPRCEGSEVRKLRANKGRRTAKATRRPGLKHNPLELIFATRHTTCTSNISTGFLSMANFWDLPKHVRERIYRLHLVKESPIDIEDFMASCEDDLGPYWNTKRAHRGMPKLLHVSKRTEREAAGIYFRENTFAWSTPWDSHQWKFRLWPRHIVLIRKIIIDGWVHPERFGKGYNADFRLLKSLKGLEELTLKVDERKALEEGLAHHPTIKWHSSLGCSPQLQLQVLHFCGVYGLRSLTNIPRLDFQPLTKEGRELHGDSGAIPGGVLDTLVRHDITRPLMSRP
jgi:hypothetical protein